MAESMQWWQTGVIYQVYPRSFQDTPAANGIADGVGDLPGITARLDYLVGLGVDALWISPFYPSPMADFGYDVADYTGVDPLFGTLADFDALLAAAHTRGLRVILDFVPNHTSDLHPWFFESRSSRSSARRDWYIWRDQPNNWQSHFGGSAWTWDEGSRQFYLHSFLAEQPDLNWRNSDVRVAMYAAMRFWLDRGVDGFRMDVLWLLIKDAQLRDNPADNNPPAGPYNSDQPETHEIVAEMRALMDSYQGARLLIGEIYLPLPQLVRYYGEPALEIANVPSLTGANLPFNFSLLQSPWNATALADLIRTYESLLPTGAWPNYVLGNHDQSRLATRLGPLQARAAAMLLLTLRGTPTLYYGDELGMEDVPIAPDQVHDPAAKHGPGRDPERSPMLWLNAPNAGFTPPGTTPWLPLMHDWPTRNAATQATEQKSMFTLYRQLLALRRRHDTLHSGAITDVAAEGNVLLYRRLAIPDGHSTDFQILLNLGDAVATVNCAPGTIVLTTLLDGSGSAVNGPVQIEAGEGLLIALQD